jgi:signal transduction histidine kinase
LSSVLYYIGIVDFNKKDFIGGLQHLNQCVASAIKENNTDALTRAYHMLATYYISQKQGDSSVYFASKSLDAMRKLGAIVQIEYHLGGAYEGLYRAYQLNDQFDSAYRYLALAQSANDSINLRRIKSLAEFQKLTLDEQQRLQNTQKARVAYQNKVRTWFLLGGIAVLLLLAIVFYRNNLQKQKAKIKIQRAYDDLKATQQQLIHAEKMASLGELTAGIAHEIQNPLNFVNNFSEVNKDLLAEMTKKWKEAI